MDGKEILQPIATKIINNICNNKSHSHAYLLEVNDFSENEDIINGFLKYLLNDCDIGCKCENCEKIIRKQHPEIKYIKPAGQFLKKEQVIELQDEFSKKPVFSKRKVYLIYGAEKFNQSSANTILKFLEEPDENIIAVLLTNNIYNVINTIKSRCQVIRFIPNEKYKHDNFIDHANIFFKYEEIGKEFIYFENSYKEYFSNKDEILHFFESGIYLYKEALNKVINAEKIEDKEISLIVDLIISNNSKMKLVKKINLLKEKMENIKYNPNTNLLIMDLFLRLENDYE